LRIVEKLEKTQMSKSTLVTALYHHTPKEIIGGRGWDFPYFAAPFLNVLNLEQPIVIYTHDKVSKDLIPFMEKHAKSEYKIIDYDLLSFKHSESILNLKRSSGKFTNETLNDDVSYVDNDRNTHLCLNKLYWLNEESQKNHFSSNKFYWIDAGLFHHGIFPEKYGGRERLSKQENRPDLYYPEHQLSIFNPNLIPKVNSLCQKFLCLRHQEMPINFDMRKALSVDGKTLGYIVGGFFGGEKQYIGPMLKQFDESLQVILNNKILTLEEDLLSCISAICPDLFQMFTFDTWSHDITTDPCYYGASDHSKSFYKFFKDLIHE